MSKQLKPLQILSELDKQDRILKCPSMPPQYIIGTKYTQNSANGITKAIIAFLTLSGHQAERINTQGRMIDKTKVFKDHLGFSRKIGSVEWQKGTGTKGSADISAIFKFKHILYGIPVKIEVKYGKDRMSEDQKKYKHVVEQSGGIYYVAKDFDSFYEWYCEFTGSL